MRPGRAVRSGLLRPRTAHIGPPSIEPLEALILPHLDDAYTLARYLLRDEHDAQDAVQDAALRAVRYAHGYRDGDARAWFLTIVRNCCFTRHRQRKGEHLTITSIDGDGAGDLPDARETDARAIERSDREAVHRAVAALPVEFREIIVLREIQQLSYAEIGAITGVPIGTVMSRLSRARKRLAHALGRASQEAG